MVSRTGSLHVSRLLLVFALLVAMLLPATVLAQDDLIGVWESDLIDAGIEGSDGLIVTISLFEDGTMETTSDFQDGEPAIFEQGDWVDNGDGTIVVSFITSDGEPYGNPVDVLFEADGDSLTAPDLTDYGPDGLVVFKIDDEPVSQAEDFGFEATADVVAAARGGAVAEDTGDEEDVFDIEGVYVSDELVDESGTGAAMVYFSADGIVQSLYANFDGASAPTSQVGTWELTDDGLIVVTMDQDLVITEDEVEAADKDEPEVVEFELVDGVLVNELFSMYPIDEIMAFWNADADEQGIGDEEISAADETVETRTFTSSLSDMAAGNVIILLADSGGGVTIAVERTDDGVSVAYVGTWEETDDGIVFTLVADAENNVLDEPIVMLMQEDEDGNLVGVEFDTEIFGEELVLEPVEE